MIIYRSMLINNEWAQPMVLIGVDNDGIPSVTFDKKLAMEISDERYAKNLINWLNQYYYGDEPNVDFKWVIEKL